MADKIDTKSRRVCVLEILTIYNFVKSLLPGFGFDKIINQKFITKHLR
ncbi:MAG: hypothetical protein IT276_08495 [Ignavibacteriaceae bacterium]|jgi:hypothetical protein|nr:hypothetical protein [Ignavibacteriaceae bacterium]HMN24982.1 hypothetical protein [Ignavibacteriaceae bacterium]HRN27024.1 hypothetical protein [Ignavibacteriaceae bacterium]HRP92805.1 hypothetical protein [Ignavibacteriaceae bacterium]HRQ54662.1 hypothetical protein [Ignavibacteriaceae bacterium]